MDNPLPNDIEVHKTLVVGQNALLARALLAHSGYDSLQAVHHDDDIDGNLDEIDCMVNFALNPSYRNQPYQEEFDIDLKLAKAIRNRPIHYIMLSSRKVYASASQWEASENSPLGPSDEYGRNKLETEQRLTDILGDRLTILRIANVIGNEQKIRRSFMSLAMNGLAQKQMITLDISPATRRDFIPDSVFGKILARILRKPISGIVNLGSGMPISVGRIADWVLEGYGKGTIEVIDNQVRDEFVLNIGKLTEHYGPVCTEQDIRRHCIEIGKQIESA
jgi:dTDP-4-dehydrorhamnose reductase/UDP-glucose 4-epimerase